MSEKYQILRNILIQLWDDKTAYSNSLKKNLFKVKSRGQCYPTALIIRRLFGGAIIKGRMGNETHYWNKIDGEEIDLTSDQYGGDGLHPVIKSKFISFVNPYTSFDTREIILWDRYQKYSPCEKCSIEIKSLCWKDLGVECVTYKQWKLLKEWKKK